MACSCDDWITLVSNNPDFVIKDPSYGWVLCWIELSENEGYTQVNRYGTPIKYCPMCGSKLAE